MDPNDEFELRRNMLYSNGQKRPSVYEKRPSVFGQQPALHQQPTPRRPSLLDQALPPPPPPQQPQNPYQKRPSLLGQPPQTPAAVAMAAKRPSIIAKEKRPSLLGNNVSPPQPSSSHRQSVLGQQKRPSVFAPPPPPPTPAQTSSPTQTKSIYLPQPTPMMNQNGMRSSVTPMNIPQSSRQTQSQQQLQSSILKMMLSQQRELGVDSQDIQYVLKTNLDSEELVGGETGDEFIPPPPPPLPPPMLQIEENDLEFGQQFPQNHRPSVLQIPSSPKGQKLHHLSSSPRHRKQSVSISKIPPPPPDHLHAQTQAASIPKPGPNPPDRDLEGLTDEALISSIMTIPQITKSTSALPITLEDLQHFSSVWSRLARAHMYHYEPQSQDLNTFYPPIHKDKAQKREAEIKHYITPTTSHHDTLEKGQLQSNPYKLHVTQLPTLIARLRPPLRPQLTSHNIRQLVAQQQRQAQLFLLPFKIHYQDELQHISEQILKLEREIFTCQQTIQKFKHSSFNSSDGTNSSLQAYTNKLATLNNALSEFQYAFISLEDEFVSFLDLAYSTLSNVDEGDINNNSAIMLLIDELNIPCDGLYVNFIDVLYSLSLRVLSNVHIGSIQADGTGAKNFAQMARDYLINLAQEQLLLNIVQKALRRQDLIAFVHHQYQAATIDANQEYYNNVGKFEKQKQEQNELNLQSIRNTTTHHTKPNINSSSSSPNGNNRPTGTNTTTHAEDDYDDDDFVMNFNPLQQSNNVSPSNISPMSPKAGGNQSLFDSSQVANMVLSYENQPSQLQNEILPPPIQTQNDKFVKSNQKTIAVIDSNPTTSTSPPITLYQALTLSDIDAVSFIIDQIPYDDIRLAVLRNEAVSNYSQRYILQYGDGSTPITHYDNPTAQPVPIHKQRLVTATNTHYQYDAGDVLRIVKIQRQWRLRKEAKMWKSIMLYMDKNAVRDALFVE
jgi:hypothetical protein